MPLNRLRHPAGQMWTLDLTLHSVSFSLPLSLSLLLTSQNAELRAVSSADYCQKKNLLNVWFCLGFLLWLRRRTGQRRFTWLRLGCSLAPVDVQPCSLR